jgi:hypothetical protein
VAAMKPSPPTTSSADTAKRLHQTVLLVALGTIVIVSRLPFLSAGYGTDWDNWRVANTARSIAETGGYSISRNPGHPLQEMFFSLIWANGPVALNGVTAIFSALAVLCFALSLQQIGCKDSMLASLALGFTPVVFINSTNASDFVPALALILAGLYCVLKHQAIVAGVLIGTAVGWRITSGAMLVPLAMILYDPTARSASISAMWKLCAVTVLVGIASFVPVLMTYGLSLFARHEYVYVPLHGIVKVATVDVWGSIGSLAIAAAVARFIVSPKASQGDTSVPRSTPVTMMPACSVAVILYAAGYLAMLINARGGVKAAYLIPAVPFAIVLLGWLLARRLFVAVCMAIIISPFLLGIVSGSYMDTFGGARFFGLSRSAMRFDVGGDQIIVDPLAGPLLLDYSRRMKSVQYAEHVLAKSHIIKAESVVLSGRWMLMIDAYMHEKQQASVSFIEGADEASLRTYRDRGVDIYYLVGAVDSAKVRQFGLQPFVP